MGLIAAFVSNLKFMDVEKPAGYSVSAAEELAESETEENTATVTKATKESPNIIVIMNEAFSDLIFTEILRPARTICPLSIL